MTDEQLQAWRESVLGQVKSFRVGHIDALWTQRYAIAIDDLDPLYFDHDYAQRHGYAAIVAPPNYLTTIRDEVSPGPLDSQLRADGLAVSSAPPIPGLAVMGGGQAIVFHEPVYCGDEIVAEKEIVKIAPQQGRSGPMVVVAEEIRYRTVAGQPKLTLTNTVLYRLLPEART